MSVTVNFEVSGNPKKNGLYPVFLRVTENARHHKMALGVFVQSRKNFNPQAKHRAWISPKEPMAKVYNIKLEDILIECNKVETELSRRGELSASSIIKNLKQENTDSVIGYLDKKHSYLMNIEKFSNALSVENLKRHLLLFSKGKDVTFNNITPFFVKDFEEFLCVNKRKCGKPLSRNSINRILLSLKGIYKQATEDNLVVSTKNPFAQIKIKTDQPHKTFLTSGEIDIIAGLQLEHGSELWHVRNYFLFSFYMAGMRVGDVISLKWNNITDTHMVYKMRKTSHIQPVLLTQKAKEILSYYRKEGCRPDDYVFPIMTGYGADIPNLRRLTNVSAEYAKFLGIRSRTVSLNRELKKLIALAGIDKNVSFHISRHSFAHYAVDTSGDVRLVKNLLGHTSLKITEEYLRGFNVAAQDKFMNQIFGG